MSSLDKSTTSVSSVFESRYDNHTNATSVAISPEHSISHEINYGTKNIIILVGLPATGKSTVSKMLTDYLNTYTQYNTQIYNCGKARRQSSHQFYDYQFFDPTNEISKFKREMIAMNSMNSLVDDLASNTINVGILDATNTTIDRRSNLINLITEKTSNQQLHLDNLIILDVQCSDPELVHYNMISKTTNEDYKHQDFNKSLDDFAKRLQNYKKAYQPIHQEELSKYKDILSGYVWLDNGTTRYGFINNTKNDFISTVEDYFAGYANYESLAYRKKVSDFMNGR